MNHEEYVRSRWEQVDVCLRFEDSDECIRIMQIGAGKGSMAVLDDWSSAYAFTKEREEQIRQVEEEIRNLGRWGNQGFDTKAEVCCFNRILAREQGALAELKKGMKL